MKKNQVEFKDFGFIPEDISENIIPGDAFVFVLDDLNNREELPHKSGVIEFLKSLKIRKEK